MSTRLIPSIITKQITDHMPVCSGLAIMQAGAKALKCFVFADFKQITSHKG